MRFDWLCDAGYRAERFVICSVSRLVGLCERGQRIQRGGLDPFSEPFNAIFSQNIEVLDFFTDLKIVVNLVVMVSHRKRGQLHGWHFLQLVFLLHLFSV